MMKQIIISIMFSTNYNKSELAPQNLCRAEDKISQPLAVDLK